MRQNNRYSSVNGRFPNVYWIVGGSCSGKSSVADELARAHDLRVHHTDGMAGQLFERADARRHPTSHELSPVFKRGFLSWMQVSPSRLFEALYELFGLLLDDVRALGSSPLVVEGMVISPAAVVEVSAMDRIVCLTGTDSFLRSQERKHPFVERHISTWENPEQTLNALTEGHIRMTHEYVASAKRCRIRHIISDETTLFEQKLKEVATHFGLI